MKPICFIKPLLAAVLLISCDKSTEPRFDQATGVRSIASLKALCEGASFAIRHDIAIRGRVTGNDRYGEFYKTLVVEDASGGISIAADRSDLWADYPFGCNITVHCNGLTLYDYGGKIVLGTIPGTDYAGGAGRIPENDLPRYLTVNSPDEAPPQPQRLSIPDIDIRHADRYLRLEGIRFTDTGPWCDIDPGTHRPITTEHTIVDAAGNTFPVRVAGTCIYAKEPIPGGTGALCGIIDYFNGKFSLRMTNYEALLPTAATLPTACLSMPGCSDPIPRR